MEESLTINYKIPVSKSDIKAIDSVTKFTPSKCPAIPLYKYISSMFV